VDAGGQIRNAVLDRYFESTGQRWIIDYKTAMPATADKTGDPEQFLQEQFLQEQKDRYRPQLERYRELVERLFADDPKPIRIALYFTGLGELHEL
jgi:ATP-dependent exoDNAse (exonuclease V) beta subunit